MTDDDPLLVAVGDSACDPLDLAFNLGLGTGARCRQAATAALAAAADPDVVAVLGDNRYESGALSSLLGSYDLSWGRLKSRTRPAIGNDHRADVVLAGHDQGYERFAKMRPDGTRDADGIRSWVVGTGGKSLYAFGTPDRNSLVRYAGGFGVLKLRLGKDGYRWRFLGEPGSTFSDAGTGTCRT